LHGIARRIREIDLVHEVHKLWMEYNMNVIEACTLLARYNEWRRGADTALDSPAKIGEAIEMVIESTVRYEAVRRLNPRQFSELYSKNIAEGIPFDDLVDDIVKEGD